jgi:ribokinase
VGKSIQAVVVNSHGVGQYVHIKKLPIQGETIRGWGWQVAQDGGKGSNSAIALGRLGIRAAYVGKVGEDPWGDLGAFWMTEAGVDISCMYRSSEISTGTGLIMLDEENKNTIVLGGSSGRALTEDEIVLGVRSFPEAKVLLTGFEIPEELSLLAARVGKEMGMFTIVNPSPLPEKQLGNLDYVDLLLVNEVEALGLFACEQQEQDDRKLLEMLVSSLGCTSMIMTLGERGALGWDPEGFWVIPGHKVSAVDSTGAGDGFGAALAAGLIEGKCIREASRWASAYAAYTVQRMGTIPSYPHRDEFEEFLSTIVWE